MRAARGFCIHCAIVVLGSVVIAILAIIKLVSMI